MVNEEPEKGDEVTVEPEKLVYKIVYRNDDVLILFRDRSAEEEE